MQPETLHRFHSDVVLSQVLTDQLRHHRADFLEHLATFLDEQLVRIVHVLFGSTVEKAEVVADVVGKLGHQLGTDDVPLLRRGRQIFALDDYRGAGVAEDEMAVAVAEVHMPGTDLGVDHQDRARLAQLDAVDRVLDAERGRRARHVHVEAETLDPQCRLHFDGDCRIGALQVGAGDDHAVDVRSGLAGAGQRFFGCLDRHLAENRPLVIAALGNARNHALGIEDAGLVGNVAALDAGSLFDEGGAGLGQRLDLAGLDGSGILAVEAMNVGVEGLH